MHNEFDASSPRIPEDTIIQDTLSGAWVYLRIYCNVTNADQVLLDLVAPLEAYLRQAELIQNWFFIRYFENGHHIRLRFYVSPFSHKEQVCALIDQYLAAYVARAVSAPLDEDSATVSQLGNLPYEYALYEPEITRYGGPRGMVVSEKHFSASSNMALRVIELERQSGEAHRNATLLLLHTLAQNFQQNTREQTRTFEQQYRWLATLAWRTPPDDAILEQEYENQRHNLQLLLPLTSLPTVHRSRAIWLPLLEEWKGTVSETYRDLEALQQEQALTEHPIGLLSSYTHMLCNRLGVFPREEAYLCYLLFRYYAEYEE